MPFNRLLMRFPDDIAVRVVGSTPEFEESMAHERQREIQTWLRKAEYTGPFVVLDDIPHIFEPGYPPLILIDPEHGITDQDMCVLRARLEAERSKR
jgi:hypothetical protein